MMDMDPTTALIVNAPPEWIPWLIMAALGLKAWTAWVNRKKMTVPVDPKAAALPAEDTPTVDPDVKG